MLGGVDCWPPGADAHPPMMPASATALLAISSR
jgi:hypothetical protein